MWGAKKKTYRVFVAKTYRSVEFFDIEADSPARAARAAEAAARHLYPDTRETALDNGWHAEDGATEIPHLGYGASPLKNELVYRTSIANIYQDLDHRRYTRINGKKLPEPILNRKLKG
jgi:hypothetical protein